MLDSKHGILNIDNTHISISSDFSFVLNKESLIFLLYFNANPMTFQYQDYIWKELFMVTQREVLICTHECSAKLYRKSSRQYYKNQLHMQIYF